MDTYSHSSFAESGDSSPHSGDADNTADEIHHQPPAPAPAPPARIKLMVSYGGRILPRSHDNQLSYVNGETKILSLDRPLRFADFAARLAALANAGDVCIKYQLPGEDLDALVSVTNDEDLDHLVLEFDRLHALRPPTSAAGGRGGSTPRLRVFLFPINPPPPSAALLEPKQERHWFVDALNSVPQPPPPPKPETLAFTPPPPPHPAIITTPPSPDYLFGLDNGFVPPPAVKVKDPAGDPPTSRENVPVEINGGGAAADHHVVSPVVSPAELQRQIQELEKLHVTDNSHHQPPPPATAPPPATIPRNGSDETLTRAYPPTTTTPTNTDYYPPKFPEKPPVPPPSSSSSSAAPTAVAPPTSYFPVQGSVMPGRYTSVAGGGDHAQFFLIPATPGYYAAAPGAASSPFLYAVAPPPAPTKVVRQPASDGTNTTSAATYAPQVAYDSNGRAVYYTSVLPPYQPVASVPLCTEAVKPVKPTVS